MEPDIPHKTEAPGCLIKGYARLKIGIPLLSFALPYSMRSMSPALQFLFEESYEIYILCL